MKTAPITTDTGPVGPSLGDEITYTFVATNSGNVTLTAVDIEEIALPFTGNGTAPVPAFASTTGTTQGTLLPGEAETWTATYTVVQADIDQGNIENRAVVTSRDPQNLPVTDNSVTGAGFDGVTTVTFTPSAGITLVKTGTFVDTISDGVAGVGDTITYAFSVTNTGNTSLTGVTVTDPLATVSGGPIALAPNATDATTFTASYTITQADINVGGVTNQATATGTPPIGAVVTDLSDSDDVSLTGDDDPTVTPLAQTASIDVVKTATAVTGAGETITYTITLENSGNVTLTNVGVTDVLYRSDSDDTDLSDNLTLTLTSGPTFDSATSGSSAGTLSPGGTATYTATYEVLQADVDAGGVLNTAVAMGSSPGNTNDVTDDSGTATGQDDPTVTTLGQTPSIALVKSGTFQDESNDGFAQVGETIDYSFTVTNTGNVTLTNVGVTDAKVAMNGGPIATLAVGAQDFSTFTASYTLTQADIDAGSVTNTATATGGYNDPAGDPQTVADVSGTANDNDTVTVTSFASAVDVVDIDAVERVLSDDLLRTTTILSSNASNISRRAADRLRVISGRACGEQVNELLRDNPVRFASDSFIIDALNDALLDEITRVLEQCVGSNFLIAGHTDSDASDDYNDVLSLNRVKAVRAALIRRSVAEDRLQTAGFGERRPIATNATEEGQALNRRVEFVLLDENVEAEPACGEGGQRTRGMSAVGNDQGTSLNGDFTSNGYNCETGIYSETWGELNVTHDDERGTLGMFNFGTLRERQADNTLRGRFVEGYVSKSDVDSVDAIGTITGVGIHAGLYGAHSTEGGLLLSYYGSAAVGQHSFELNAGADVDGNYTYAGLFAGAAVGGAYEFEKYIAKPRVGVDLAYAKSIGSEISVPDVSLDIDPATYERSFVEIGLSRELEIGKLEFAPRMFCATNGDASANACGYGGSLNFEALAEAEGAQWDVTIDYEEIGDRQSASLAVSRSQEIFSGYGVTKSTFGASAMGAIQAGQTFEFAW